MRVAMFYYFEIIDQNKDAKEGLVQATLAITSVMPENSNLVRFAEQNIKVALPATYVNCDLNSCQYQNFT